MLPNKKNATIFFLDFGLFWPFFNQKKPKIDQKWRKLPKSKPFYEISWNLVCRCLLVNENSPQSPIFGFCLFWPFFLLKRAEIDKNEENWQNPNRLMKFSEIWFVDASQQKNSTKNFFWILTFFSRFLIKKIAKID